MTTHDFRTVTEPPTDRISAAERESLEAKVAFGAFDVGEDGLGYLRFRLEWISETEVTEILRTGETTIARP